MDTAELIQIQSQFKELTKLIQELADNKVVKPEAMQSDKIEELSAALSIAQSQFKPTYKNKQGTFTEYADLGACIAATKHALSANGLSVLQPIMETDGGMFLYTIITHGSGQFVKTKIKIIPPSDSDMRKLFSQIILLRRYSLASMVGIVGSAEDDDGELADQERDERFSKGTALKEQIRNSTGVDNNGPIVTISQDQLDELNYELREWPELTKEVKDKWGCRSLAEMPKDRYRDAITRIRKLKEERKNDNFKS